MRINVKFRKQYKISKELQKQFHLVDSISATKKYEELSMLLHRWNLWIYKVQLESASRNAEANKSWENEENWKTNAINDCKHPSLNNVYGGMLSAMGNKG
jgi:hypothetical protein